MKLECPYLSQFPSIQHGFFGQHPNSFLTRTHKEFTLDGRPLPLLTLKQVHGDTVLHACKAWKNKMEGDGMVTNEKGVALGIITADCGPVLFYDPKAQVIGACHAGWKGAKKGIIKQTIKAMEKFGAERSSIQATLGPTIQKQNYEVGPEFPDLIGEKYEIYFSAAYKKGHHFFDLPAYISFLLLQENISKPHNLKRDTFCDAFASRRRFLSQGIEKFTFSNVSVIAIL